jgi:hypothetical protein
MEMTARQTNNAPTSQEVVDRYFLEHRAKLIDIAAFLDRVDRAGDSINGKADYRVAALSEALSVLSDGRANRAARTLAIFSDMTGELPQSAEGVKRAEGAAKAGEIA